MDETSQKRTARSPADVKTYECNDCGRRMEAEHQPEVCPACGGGLVDISVPRE